MSEILEKPERSRNFAFILYEDSLEPDWKDVLRSTYESVLYILHDKDVVVNEETGEAVLKKAHYHVLIMFKNARTINSVLKLARRCGCANGKLESVSNAQGYARYLCHLDDPKKYQYNLELVESLGGADYKKIIGVKDKAEDEILPVVVEILRFIDEKRIHIYSDLIRYCASKNHKWLSILMSHKGRMVNEYIKSEAFAFREENPQCCYRRFYFADEIKRNG